MSNDYYSAGVAAANSSTAANSACSRWLTEEVFKLIDIVQRDEAIYNPRHKYYFCRPYVENFWREVDLKLEKNPGASLAKWTNLRISFRREYTNYLEEKVPPCWSYFDRMFFLHPYLRKKHPPPKSLDTQVQDALVQISTLSNRLQRERAAQVAAASLSNARNSSQPLDNYLDYFDEPEPNNSELDEIIDEEQREEVHSLNDEIKSECDDPVDDYEDHLHDAEEADDVEMRNFVLNSLTSNAAAAEKRQHLRLQHWHRLQTRSYHEDLRSKRPRSQDGISSSTQAATSSAAQQTQRILCSSTPAQCLVRPTFTKPIEIVSTTTNHTQHGSNNDVDLTHSSEAAATTTVTSQASSTSFTAASGAGHTQQQQQQRHNLSHHHHHQHRLEIAAISAANNSNMQLASSSIAAVPPAAASTASLNAPLLAGAASAAATTPHMELCDCKTDPDAMFLMSLLPDIQKLNGRDRGKIKIAFQNILQDYLYPD